MGIVIGISILGIMTVWCTIDMVKQINRIEDAE
jgi:hypothetical protein